MRSNESGRGRVCAGLVAFLVLLVSSPARPAAAGAGTGDTQLQQGGSGSAAELTRQPAHNWAVDAANNEIKVVLHEGSYLRYRVRTVDHRGDRVRDTIETKDGSVARLVLKDGHGLTAEEDKDERDRLSALLDSPSAFERHEKEYVDGKKLAIDLIRLLPDAMDFTYAPGQPQTSNAAGPEVVIDYAPKPGWNPPTTISAGLKGLRGRAWIDARSRYVVRMEGEIFQSVNFGWGMLAHIYPGGRLLLEQQRVDQPRSGVGERWIFTHFKDDLRLRAVMVKTVAVQTESEASRFSVVSGSPSYQDAIRALLNTPLSAE